MEYLYQKFLVKNLHSKIITIVWTAEISLLGIDLKLY